MSGARLETRTLETGTLETRTTEAELRRHCERRLKALRAGRRSWEPHWRELAQYILPRRGRFLDGGHDASHTSNRDDRGGKLNGKILNSAGTLAARTLAAGLVSGVTSPARPWFRLSLGQRQRAASPAVRHWLDEVQDVLMRIFAASNFYNAIGVAYEELAVFGTAAIVVLEDWEDVVRFHTLTAGEYFLAASHRGTADTLYRVFPLSIAALVQEYGLDRVSPAAARRYRDGDLDGEVEVAQAIEPNDRRVIGVPDARGMAWRSIHWETASGLPGGAALLRVSGYRRFCVMAPRWHVAGNDVYGRSPGMDALPDVRSLQVLERDKARAIEMISRPPMVGPPSLRSEAAQLLPGSLTYLQPGAGGTLDHFRPAFEIDPRLGDVQAEIAARETQVARAFYADLFLAASRLDDVRTATEVLDRREEKLLQLGPMLERLHDELLDPLIKRVMEIAESVAGNGLAVLPPRPPEIGAGEIEVEYVSTLAQAQRAVGTAGIERFVAFVANLAALRPEALDKIDIDAAVDDYGDRLGIPARLVVDSASAAFRRGARAAAHSHAREPAPCRKDKDQT